MKVKSTSSIEMSHSFNNSTSSIKIQRPTPSVRPVKVLKLTSLVLRLVPAEAVVSDAEWPLDWIGFTAARFLGVPFFEGLLLVLRNILN